MGRVAVVGAGPAGCSAALALVEAGHRLDLFERGAPGKDKPCGDAFLPDAVRELQVLGVAPDTFRRGKGNPFQRLDLWDDRQSMWSLPLGDEGWIAPRAIVDQALRDVVSRRADVHYQAIVRQVIWADGKWQVSVNHQFSSYDAVVLATGATNTLSRRFGIEGCPIFGASVSAYGALDGVQAPLFQFTPLGSAGYGWIFPLADGKVNVGVCAVTSGPKGLPNALTDYLRRWDITDGCPLRGGGGPFWSDAGTRWHDSRGIVSCGDAAGLVDPLTGEGIFAALQSGRAAGRAIADWLLQGRNPSVLNSYSDWIVGTFHARYSPTPARRCWTYLSQASSASRSVDRLFAHEKIH